MSRWDALASGSGSGSDTNKETRRNRTNYNDKNNYQKTTSTTLVRQRDRLLQNLQKENNDSKDKRTILADLKLLLLQQPQDSKLLGETIYLLLLPLNHTTTPPPSTPTGSHSTDTLEGVLFLISTILNNNHPHTVKPNLSNSQASRCLTSLLDMLARTSTYHDMVLTVICDFIAGSYKQLPAEKIANDVVATIFIQAATDNWEKSTTGSIINTLTIILQDSHYASALLAPLTTHVNDQGQERTTQNNIGYRLVTLMESKLPTSQSCFIVIIRAIHRVVGCSLMLIPTMVIMEKSLELSLQQQHTVEESLQLLHALLQTYPSTASIALRSLLLSPTPTKIPVLLNLLHNQQALICCTAMISGMPWQQWINLTTSHTGSMHYFGQRLSETLTKLIHQLLQLQLQNTRDDRWIMQYYSLCTVIFTKIPFSRIACPLTNASTLLMNQMVTNLMEHYENEALVSCILQCIGGKLLPNGTRTCMVVPMELFLKQHSKTFYLWLWNQIQQTTTAKNILGAWWNMDPTCVEWELFQTNMTHMIQNKNSRSDGLWLLDKWMAARKELNLVEIDISFIYLLLETCGTQQPPCRLLSMLGIYSSMQSCDWEHLGSTHVEFIVSHCTNTQVDAAVRAAACKACGELASHGLHWERVAATLAQALDDTIATVRSMAAFGVGNLALAALRDGQEQKVVPMCEKILHLVKQDINGKVVQNAIRALGHLGGCIMDPSLIQQSIHALNHTLAHAICVTNHKSWNERSNAKKQAWGACRALAFLLDRPLVHKDATQNYRESLLLLIQCLDDPTVKISSAAAHAMLHIPLTTLQVLSHTDGLVGQAMVKCIGHILTETTTTRKHASGTCSQHTDLLRHLLTVVSSVDATFVINVLSNSDIQFLYDFMLQHWVPADSFDAFAIAFGNLDNVWLEQKFSSRALERRRANGGMVEMDDEDEL